MIVGLLTNPPVQYSDFNSLATGFLVSLAVGVAAGLATVDDVGRRELIGLAATAQVHSPARLGLRIVLGFQVIDATTPPRLILGSAAGNILGIVIANLATYAEIGVKGKALKFFKMNSGKTESRSTRPELRITNSATGGANE